MTDINILFQEYNGNLILAIILIIILFIIIYFCKFAGKVQDDTRRPLKNSSIKNSIPQKSNTIRDLSRFRPGISTSTAFFSARAPLDDYIDDYIYDKDEECNLLSKEHKIKRTRSLAAHSIKRKRSSAAHSNKSTRSSADPSIRRTMSSKDLVRGKSLFEFEHVNKAEHDKRQSKIFPERGTETERKKQSSNLKCSSIKISVVKSHHADHSKRRTSPSAGVKVRISKSGLMFGAKVIIDLIAENIKAIPIPENFGKTFVALCNLTDIKIVSFTKPDYDIEPDSVKGIKVSIKNCAIVLNFKWSYKFGIGFLSIGDSGLGSATTTSISLDTSLMIGRDSNDKPTVSSTSCSCIIGGLKIHFDGGLRSSIYNIFKCLIENNIRKSVQKTVCSQVAYIINHHCNSMLATFKTKIKIHSHIFLNYTLTEDPIFTSDYLETSHVGEFFSNTGILYNQDTPAWNIIPDNDKMVHIALTEKLFNSAAYVFQQLGMINQNFPIDTNFLNVLFPDYKDEKLQLEIQLSEAPFFKITTSSFLIHAITRIKLIRASRDVVVDLRVSLQIDCHIYFGDNRVKGEVTKFVPEIYFDSGKDKDENSQRLTRVVHTALEFVKPFLNEFGAVGFPLPSIENLVLADGIWSRADGYAKLASDFEVEESN